MRICLSSLFRFCGAILACGYASVASAGPLDWPALSAECRPWAYHWWLGSAVDKENLAKEFNRYRQGGLGGVHIVPIYGAKGAEGRYIDFLSPQWMDMLAFAVTEGGRQGLGVDVTTGTGWCFGGPHIPPELGCRDLVLQQIPFPRDGRLPEALRPPRVAVQALVAYGPEGTRREITDRLRPDGAVDWTPAAGDWSLYVLAHRFAGRMVKRAAPGGAGPMLNPFSAGAMRKHLERFSAAFPQAHGPAPRAMYHDSYEYSGDWSAELPEEFAKRRGYRLEDELPALAGRGDADRVGRVRCDVSQTRSDMMIEDVFPQWVRWCHKRGMKTRNQAHGSPANWLDFYAIADMPDTEMFGHGGPDPLVSQFDRHIAGADRDPLISKYASSAAHLAGRRLVSSETGTWLAEHFCETFEEFKCEVDLFFLSGVNHVFYHGCVYSPDDAAWPGWVFYASTQMNPRNPLWREAATLNDYVARCQSILQSDQPDNELLVYWPIHDLWSRGVTEMTVHDARALGGPFGATARMLWDRGYGFDYVSDRLLARLHVEDGSIAGPGGASWQAVVVPECQHMPHTTLAKLLDLAAAGATVIFDVDLPGDVPGLGRLDERRAQLQKQKTDVKRRLVPAADGRVGPGTGPQDVAALGEAPWGQGRVLVGALPRALEAASVRRETLVERPGLKFLRGRHAEGRHYLIVNHDVNALDDWIRLATPARAAAVMDPLSGRTGVARLRRASDGAAEVHLRLEPGHSIILRTFEKKEIEGPAWTWPAPGGLVAAIEGPWQVEFIAGGPVRPEPLEMKRLRSWTVAGAAAEAFAGTARYRTTFDLPEGQTAADRAEPLVLDLGEVKHVARVHLNGELLGPLIMRPYRLSVPGGLLRSSGNVLEVEVTNLAANRIRDLDRRGVPWRIFHDINVVDIHYRPFSAADWPVFDSGLLGPVRINKNRDKSDP